MELLEEILITCSFMTPMESKNSTNINRVRCFTKNALVSSIADQKWDLVKVICTQPFNKHVQYGISFIKIHVAENDETKNELKPLVPSQYLPQKNSTSSGSQENLSQCKKIGNFLLREDSPESESEKTTSLFKRWKTSKDTSLPSSQNLSTASAIREASSPAALKAQSESLKPSKIIKRAPNDSKVNNNPNDESKPLLDRNRNDLYYGGEEDASNEKFERKLFADQERLKAENESKLKEPKKKTETPSRHDTSSSKFKNFIDDTEKSAQCTTPNSKVPKIRPVQNIYPSTIGQKRSISPGNTPKTDAKKLKTEKKTEYRPFNELLKGVVLVISGIQNPDRANLRRKALDMGAKYKPDWDNTCTHLICAFKNTPKYNQVKGHGKIVAKLWIEKCYSLKKRLPWRRYAMDDDESEKNESEEEIFDLSLKPPDAKEELTELKENVDNQTTEAKNKDPSTDDTLALYDLGDGKSGQNDIQNLTSGSDTEDEIEKVRNLNSKINVSNKQDVPIEESITPTKQKLSPKVQTPSKQKTPKKFTNDDDVYDASTEEEGEFTKSNNTNGPSSKLDFFANKKFFIGEKINSVEGTKLKEHIKKYKGEICDTLTDADFVIAGSSYGTSSNFKGIVAKPQWIYDCNDMEGLVPIKYYEI